MSFRNSLWQLEAGGQVGDIPFRVVSAAELNESGALTFVAPSQASREYRVGPIVEALPYQMDRELRARFGGELSDRELRLLASGVELAVRAVEAWVAMDPLPETSDPEL